MLNKRFQKLDVISVLYLFGACIILALRLLATEWTDDLDLFVYLAFFALLGGVLLGASRFPGWLVALFGTIYGAFTIPWLYGISLNRDLSWYDRVFNIMGSRLKLAASQYATNIMVTDPILFLAVMAIIFWAMLFFSGYILTRKAKALTAIILPGLVLMIISHYDQVNPGTANYIFFFVLFTLLLIGRSVYTSSLGNWAKEHVSLTPKAQVDLRQGIIFFIVVILLVSWSIPLTSSQTQRYSKFWSNVTRPWETVRDRIADALQPLRNATIGQEGSFDASLSLGNSSSLGTSILFTVTPDILPESGLNFYWKVRSYNLYMNDMWLTSNDYDYIALFPQRFKLDSPVWSARLPYSFSFFMKTNQAGNFYYLNSPEWVSRQVEFMVLPLPNDKQDVIAAFADPLLASGESYQVQAEIPNPTVTQLRAVEQEYPDWLERYTQLPPNFPERIRNLAIDLTQNLGTPYDKTQAITRYLRNNITYDTDMGVIPELVDPIEWFLFEKQSGFCNYYATAEVLMLRSIGIPARLSVGYAQGQYDEESGAYQVQQKDKHAWAEVYFNQFGWIEFEPTTAISLISRPLGTPVENTPQEPINLPQIEPDEPDLPEVSPSIMPEEEPQFIPSPTVEKSGAFWWFGLLILLLSVGLSLMVWRIATPQAKTVALVLFINKTYAYFNWTTPAWLKNASAVHKRMEDARAYQMLEKSADVLSSPFNDASTPAERGEQLSKMLPEMRGEIERVVSEYEKQAYSPHTADNSTAHESGLLILKTAQFQRLSCWFKKKPR